jgi:hypothetical protein
VCLLIRTFLTSDEFASQWQGQPLGSRRKVTQKKHKEGRERPHFTPNDIVRAINGVETAGLQVYGVEITPTGAINIWTQPRQAEPDKQISSKPNDTGPLKEQA